MKYLFFVLFIFVSSICFTYDLQYKTMPSEINCDFQFVILNQKNNEKIHHLTNIGFKTKSIENNELVGEINNNNIERTCKYSLKQTKNKLIIENISGLDLYPNTNMLDETITSQLELPDYPVKVGDTWVTKIVNPLDDKYVYISNTLIRVANNVATIFFSVKNPYRGNSIKTEQELMLQKAKDGSTFYFDLDNLAGHAEVSGTGVWTFDMDKGMIVDSNQFFKITSLMKRKDLKEIKEVSDFIYVDINMKFLYKFK